MEEGTFISKGIILSYPLISIFKRINYLKASFGFINNFRNKVDPSFNPKFFKVLLLFIYSSSPDFN